MYDKNDRSHTMERSFAFSLSDRGSTTGSYILCPYAILLIARARREILREEVFR